MTFEEWFKKEGYKFIAPYTLALAAWSAAKEDSKEIVRVSFSQLGNEWAVFDSRGNEIKDSFGSRSAGQRWAIENGYRVEES